MAVATAAITGAAHGQAPLRPTVLTGQDVLTMAENLAGGLAADARVPSEVPLTTVEGVALRLPAGDALYLMCQMVAEWQAANALPATVPLLPQTPAPSEIATAPQPGDARTMSPADLVAQCGPMAGLMRQIGRMPAGVWVGTQRLSPAEYTGGLATLLQHFRRNKTFPAQVGVKPYLPPKEWMAAAPADPGAATGAAWPGGPAAGQPAEETPPPPPEAKLALVPAKDTKLTGMAEIAALYQGPTAFARLFVNGRLVGISNRFPFTYKWDTRLEPDGPATVSAQAVGSQGEVLASAEQRYILSNGNVMPAVSGP